jgi:TonB-dependent receptor
MRRVIFDLKTFLFLVLLSTASVFAAGGNVEGTVVDEKTGEALAGANIILAGTSRGAAADMDGKFVISNVTPGTYVIKASYIGYYETKATIVVKDGQTVKQNFKLAPVTLQGETVVVTAQAFGQTQAINQQLAADQIMNVVSAAKIQELPDANAAESIGRLPGIAVMRSGGEGNEVVIRGLAPKYNAVTIDGVQMSSSDPNDRSSDLSMISSSMLEGIQVTKSATADMDADVLGGTVNFVMREAKTENTGKPDFHLLMQGSYNNLANAYNKTNNYKYVFSAENRFLDDLLGVFAQIDIERKNLTSNEMGAAYTQDAHSTTGYYVQGLNLYDIPRDRQRTNAALVMDYKIPDGKIKFTNFLSSGSTNIQSRQEYFDLVNNQHTYTLAGTNSKLSVLTNALEYQQELPWFSMNVKLSHTYSETKDPNDWSANFVQTSAGLSQFANVANVNPQDIVKGATNDYTKTLLNTINSSSSFSKERILTGSVDLEKGFELSSLISGKVKFGGKYQYKTRSYNYDQYSGFGLMSPSSKVVDTLIEKYFGLPTSTTDIPVTYFTDPHFDYGKFLNGDYKMMNALDYGKLHAMADYLKNNAAFIAANQGSIAYTYDSFNSLTRDYDGHEAKTGFYLMPIVNIGQEITAIAGLRYQNLQTTYTATRGQQSSQSYQAYQHFDTTVTKSHGFWLPDFSVKYKPFAWFDVRLSYSNTIAYPDYNTIIPRIDRGLSSANGIPIVYNNTDLVPARATNYDAYLSFYENTIGMFTVGGFVKQVKNLIYSTSFTKTGADVVPYLPYVPQTTPSGTFVVNTYVNNDYTVNDYGLEVDWQTHFWYLPEPFSGLVLSANFTHIYSKAQYPVEIYITPAGSRRPVPVDTSYYDRLLDQPNEMVNLSLGYDYKAFSIRVSMLYQTDIFTGNSIWPQLKTNTLAYRRWDLAVKQELPWYNIQLYGDVNNMNGAYDISVIQGGGVPRSQQEYGMNADFGLRIKF